jgi:hypothetical protein
MSRPKRWMLLCLAFGLALVSVNLPENQVRATDSISIIAPEGKINILLEPNTSNQSLISAASTGSVTSNVTFNVTAKDTLIGGKPPGTEGKMAEWDGVNYVSSGGRTLTDAILVWSNDTDHRVGTAVTLDGTDQLVLDHVPDNGEVSVPLLLVVTQKTEIGDVALADGHLYRIIITFTASSAN